MAEIGGGSTVPGPGVGYGETWAMDFRLHDGCERCAGCDDPAAQDWAEACGACGLNGSAAAEACVAECTAHPDPAEYYDDPDPVTA